MLGFKKIIFGAAVVLAFASSAQAEIINGGFEQDYDEPLVSYIYKPTGTGWVFEGAAGVFDTGSAWVRTPSDGVRAAFIQSSATISQTFTLATDVTSFLSFSMASRPLPYDATQTVDISIDGISLGIYGVTQSWVSTTIDVGFLSAGEHTLEFAGQASVAVEGDVAALLDEVNLDSTLFVAEPVPVPAPLIMVSLGLLGLVFRRKVNEK